MIIAQTDRTYGEAYNIGGEFPFRSIIRGDFESRHFGTVTWAALERFKKYLLDQVLSNNGERLPEPLWKESLTNYVNNNLRIIQQERQRWGYQNTGFGAATQHGFFSGGSGSSSLVWQENLFSSANTINISRTKQRETRVFSGRSYQIVAAINYNFSNQYQFSRLGEEQEFSLYMPEYENFSSSSVNTILQGDPPSPVYFSTSYSSFFSDTGILTDMEQHLRQLLDLRYDLSNLDETLTKDWLFCKLNHNYFSEVLIDDKLTDAYLRFRFDSPAFSSESNPDMIIYENWKTKKNETISQNPEMAPNAEILKSAGIEFGFNIKLRPNQPEYMFDRTILWYQPTTSVRRHSDNDPRIIAAETYVPGTAGGQPNHEKPSSEIVSLAPMRLRCCRVQPFTVYVMDSNCFSEEKDIDKNRDLVLPVVIDKRITYYDTNFGTENQKVIEYNREITKEFP